MRNLFTLLFTVLLGFTLQAQQVERDLVIVEGATGFW